MPLLIVEYRSIARTPAGWRDVTVTAEAERTSPCMATVVRVIAIDGETPALDMSRTGAKRQAFNGLRLAAREVGTHKRLSACKVIE